MNKIHHEVHKTIETSLKKNHQPQGTTFVQGLQCSFTTNNEMESCVTDAKPSVEKNETLNDNKLITSVIPTKRFQSETTTYHDYQSEPNPSTDRFSSYLYGLND